jgi:hypothetical protein
MGGSALCQALCLFYFWKICNRLTIKCLMSMNIVLGFGKGQSNTIFIWLYKFPAEILNSCTFAECLWNVKKDIYSAALPKPNQSFVCIRLVIGRIVPNTHQKRISFNILQLIKSATWTLQLAFIILMRRWLYKHLFYFASWEIPSANLNEYCNCCETWCRMLRDILPLNWS